MHHGWCMRVYLGVMQAATGREEFPQEKAKTRKTMLLKTNGGEYHKKRQSCPDGFSELVQC